MNTKKINPIAYFIITLLFGCLGIHKFIDCKIGAGVLYLLTGGVFGIGWLIDTVKALIMLIKGEPSNEPAPSSNDNNTFYSKVKGVTFNCEKNNTINRQDVVAQLKSGDVLKVEKYTFDGKPAIMLLNQAGLDIGNLSSDITKDVYDKNNISVVVSEVTGGGELSYGCNIIITC